MNHAQKSKRGAVVLGAALVSIILAGCPCAFAFSLEGVSVVDPRDRKTCDATADVNERLRLPPLIRDLEIDYTRFLERIDAAPCGRGLRDCGLSCETATGPDSPDHARRH